MSIFEAVSQMKKMLTSLDKWIDKGVEHAQKKAFDPNVLVNTRLAPDMYPFVRQVQSACDGAKLAAARLTGKEAPKHEDKEQTIDELHTRIRAVTTYLDTYNKGDFEGAETRIIALPFLEGKVLSGSDYLMEMVVPNFYFHVARAYAILRQSGVELGKRDFISSLNIKDP